MDHGDQSQQPPRPASESAATDRHQVAVESPNIEDFLLELAAVAADIAPGSHCSVTLDRGAQAVTVAATDAVAAALDEVQCLHDDGPSLAAMRAGARLDVPALAEEDRWVEVGSYASAFGVDGGVFLPLLVQGDPVGVLSVYLGEAADLAETQVRRAQLIAEEASAGLSTMLRRFSTIPDDQLLRALTTRRLIDQALGVLMHAGQVSSRVAVGTLLDLALTANRSPGEVAAEVVQSAAGGRGVTDDLS